MHTSVVSFECENLVKGSLHDATTWLHHFLQQWPAIYMSPICSTALMNQFAASTFLVRFGTGQGPRSTVMLVVIHAWDSCQRHCASATQWRQIISSRTCTRFKAKRGWLEPRESNHLDVFVQYVWVGHAPSRLSRAQTVVAGAFQFSHESSKQPSGSPLFAHIVR